MDRTATVEGRNIGWCGHRGIFRSERCVRRGVVGSFREKGKPILKQIRFIPHNVSPLLVGASSSAVVDVRIQSRGTTQCFPTCIVKRPIVSTSLRSRHKPPVDRGIGGWVIEY